MIFKYSVVNKFIAPTYQINPERIRKELKFELKMGQLVPQIKITQQTNATNKPMSM